MYCLQIDCTVVVCVYSCSYHAFAVSCSDSDDRFTFENHLANQKQLSHGIEYSQCKHVPKIVAVLCHRLSELFGAQGTDACTLQEVATWCEEQDCTPSSEVGGCRSFGEYHCREPKNEMHQHSPHHIEGPQVSASASHFSAEIGELGRSHKGAPHDLYWSGSPPGLCGQYGHEGQSYDSWGVIVLRAKQVKHLKVCCVGVVVCPHQEEHLLKCVPAYSCP